MGWRWSVLGGSLMSNRVHKAYWQISFDIREWFSKSFYGFEAAAFPIFVVNFHFHVSIKLRSAISFLVLHCHYSAYSVFSFLHFAIFMCLVVVVFRAMMTALGNFAPTAIIEFLSRKKDLIETLVRSIKYTQWSRMSSGLQAGYRLLVILWSLCHLIVIT